MNNNQETDPSKPQNKEFWLAYFYRNLDLDGRNDEQKIKDLSYLFGFAKDNGVMKEDPEKSSKYRFEFHKEITNRPRLSGSNLHELVRWVPEVKEGKILGTIKNGKEADAAVRTGQIAYITGKYYELNTNKEKENIEKAYQVFLRVAYDYFKTNPRPDSKIRDDLELVAQGKEPTHLIQFT